MSAVTLLRELEELNIRLSLGRGHILLLDGRLTNEIITACKRHKEELISLITLHCTRCGHSRRYKEAGFAVPEGWCCDRCEDGDWRSESTFRMPRDSKLHWMDLDVWRYAYDASRDKRERYEVIYAWSISAGGWIAENGKLCLPANLADCAAKRDLIKLAYEVGLIEVSSTADSQKTTSQFNLNEEHAIN